MEVTPPPPGQNPKPKSSAGTESPSDEASAAQSVAPNLTTSLCTAGDNTQFPPFPALNGYCIVALKSMRFVKADPKIESVYNHRVYQFSSMAAKLEFDHAPESYCVQFDGADPVEMLQTGIAVEGQYLREHNGRFYLFLSKKSWEAFKAGAGTAPKSVAATTSLESPAVASTSVIQLSAVGKRQNRPRVCGRLFRQDRRSAGPFRSPEPRSHGGAGEDSGTRVDPSWDSGSDTDGRCRNRQRRGVSFCAGARRPNVFARQTDASAGVNRGKKCRIQPGGDDSAAYGDRRRSPNAVRGNAGESLNPGQ